MNLFIFSFKKSFLSLLTMFFLVILGVFFAVVAVLPRGGNGQNQHQTNVIRAERFVFGQTPEVVILGSSLSARLPENRMPKNWFLLSFGGGSVFTGLELVQQKKEKPRLLVVETNLLTLNADSKFISSVNSSTLAFLKRRFKIFREEFQPSNLIHHFLKSFREGSRIAETVNHKLVDQLVTDHEKTFNVFESNDLMQSQISKIVTILNDLRQAGIRIALLQMPIDPRIEILPREVAFYESLYRQIGNTDILKITFSQNVSRETTDGLHLSLHSASFVLDEVKRQVEKFGLVSIPAGDPSVIR